MKNQNSRSGYNRFLLLVAGLGGLLFGVDVGIISGALPYLQDTFMDAGHILTAGQTSLIVAAVFLGGVFSTLFAGVLADWLGRKPMLIFSGILFVISVPVIAWSLSYNALIFGRLLQGISGGLIGVVVPLYLAECLSAGDRGKGTGVFQWLLTLGIVAAAVIGFYFSGRVEEVAKLGDANKLFAVKDTAWRGMFWVSLPPGILFVLGGFLVSESPRWLFRRGKKEAALRALLRSRSDEQAKIELQEMEETAADGKSFGEFSWNKFGVAAATEIYSAVCPGVRHSRLQSGHWRKFCHWLQCDNSYPGRLERQTGAPRLRCADHCEFPHDNWRDCAGGPQGPEISAFAWQRGRHCFAAGHRIYFSQK